MVRTWDHTQAHVCLWSSFKKYWEKVNLRREKLELFVTWGCYGFYPAHPWIKGYKQLIRCHCQASLCWTLLDIILFLLRSHLFELNMMQTTKILSKSVNKFMFITKWVSIIWISVLRFIIIEQRNCITHCDLSRTSYHSIWRLC